MVGIAWGIIETKFANVWKRRIMLFDSLVKSVWGEDLGVNRVSRGRENPRKIFEMDAISLEIETPGYIMREETKREKLRVAMGRRAVKYEERTEERPHYHILQ